VPGFPTQRLDVSQPVVEGQVVQVEPLFAPIGMRFRKGEGLRVRICGVDEHTFPPVDQAILEVPEVENLNAKGDVMIHCGVENEGGSYIVLPVA